MQDSTLKIVEVTLRADSTIQGAERNRLLKLARNGESAEPGKNSNDHSTPRIFSREQAAELLGGRTTRFVDGLCRKGFLKKFTMPGGKRAIGVTSTSLENFLAGGAA
jgi:hypothetical protein